MAAAMLALTLVTAPSLGYARENEDRKEKTEKRECFKAFGHLFAPGLVKVGANTNLSVGDDCRLPKGILNKLKDRTASTTLDTIAPVISNLQTKVKSSSKVEVRWDSNEKTIGAVFFGTTTPVVSQVSASSSKKFQLNATSTNSLKIVDRDYDRDHKIQIKNLNASTTYYVVVVSQDKSGNVTISSPVSVTTNATVGNTIGAVISNLVTSVSTSTINVSWKTNKPTTSKVFYGTSTVNTSTSLSAGNNTLKNNHSVNISGLATGTVYHLIPQSVDANGNITTSAEYVVTTSI